MWNVGGPLQDCRGKTVGECGGRVELRSEVKVSAERSHERGCSCENSAHLEPDTAVKVKGRRGLRYKHGCLFG